MKFSDTISSYQTALLLPPPPPPLPNTYWRQKQPCSAYNTPVSNSLQFPRTITWNRGQRWAVQYICSIFSHSLALALTSGCCSRELKRNSKLEYTVTWKYNRTKPKKRSEVQTNSFWLAGHEGIHSTVYCPHNDITCVSRTFFLSFINYLEQHFTIIFPVKCISVLGHNYSWFSNITIWSNSILWNSNHVNFKLKQNRWIIIYCTVFILILFKNLVT